MRSRLARLVVPTFAIMWLTLGCGDTSTAPSPVFKLAVSPSAVAAGATSIGTVTLRDRTHQPVGINLSSSDAVASVPSSILVPAGIGVAVFPVTTRLVAADTVARISASAAGIQQEVSLQVVAPIARPLTLDALELDGTAVLGGQNMQGTVRLTAAAPAGGLSITLRSSNAAAVVPAMVLVPFGAMSAGFTLSTRPVTLETQLEISAAYSDQIKAVPLRVIP